MKPNGLESDEGGQRGGIGLGVQRKDESKNGSSFPEIDVNYREANILSP